MYLIYFVFLVVCRDEEGQVLVLKDVWKVHVTYKSSYILKGVSYVIA